ncbi:tyrosine-type recombinase/integrase [Lacrimispora sp.]|uniref:tyrosine-type recombinase/integrase n=1 Tax=Lacrimispora sp. TaxID=2719234 RepID=UPI0028A5A983|nr:site-specific integrase [Lacrimispora sp.]
MARKYKQRADGRYFTQVSTGKYDDDGTPIRVPVYAKSSTELERKVGELRTDIKRGTYANDQGKTVGQYAYEWYHAYKEGHVAHGTELNYTNVLKLHFDLIKDIRLKDLTKTDIQRQINATKSPEACRRIKYTINQVLECAIEDGLLYRNVSKNIKVARPPKPEKRALTEMEKAAIKKCNFLPMEKTFIDVIFGCGLRRGEALGLMKSDIDFTRKGIHVKRSLSYAGGKKELKEPKTKTSIRFVPAPEWLMDSLKEYISTLNSLYLFHNKNEDVISIGNFCRMWNKIYQKINTAMGGTDKIKITDLTPHTFRHNYATMLYYAGVDVKEAQKLLGHSSITITLEIYTHLQDNQQTIEKINTIAL